MCDSLEQLPSLASRPTGRSQNKIQHQRHRKHNHKCPDGQRQGLAVPIRLNFTHLIQPFDDWMQGHKVDPDGDNGGDHRTDGNDLIAQQHHHNQKGQKNQLAVGHPVHQILHKQSIRFPVLGCIPLFEGIHTVAIFEIGLEIQNEDVG